jgi:glutathione S-transferase
MLKLWGRATSSNVMKVVWLLEHMSLPYERVDVGGPFGGTDTAAYRALNPLGLVPSLEDDDFALFESNAILRYLCYRYAPAGALYPADAAARGVVDCWLDFQQTALTRPQTILFIGLIRTPPEQRDHAAINAAMIWAIIDARLARQPFICGAALSLADIAWGVHAHRWLTMAIPGRPASPSLRGWYNKLLKDAAYQKAVASLPIV